MIITEQIQNLKTELREFIEQSNTITEGKWTASRQFVDWGFQCVDHIITKTHNFDYDGRGISIQYGGIISCTGPVDKRNIQSKQDASFIARSRNISPTMAKCLLVAVESLDRVSETRELVEHGDDNGNGPYVSNFRTSHAMFAEKQLQEILAIWEVAK